jgi:hypothetical protein
LGVFKMGVSGCLCVRVVCARAAVPWVFGDVFLQREHFRADLPREPADRFGGVICVIADPPPKQTLLNPPTTPKQTTKQPAGGYVPHPSPPRPRRRAGGGFRAASQGERRPNGSVCEGRARARGRQPRPGGGGVWGGALNGVFRGVRWGRGLGWRPPTHQRHGVGLGKLLRRKHLGGGGVAATRLGLNCWLHPSCAPSTGGGVVSAAAAVAGQRDQRGARPAARAAVPAQFLSGAARLLQGLCFTYH